MPKTKSKSQTQKKNGFFAQNRVVKLFVIFLVIVSLCLTFVLQQSLFKDYPVQGKKQKLSINTGETYSRFIDQLAADHKVKFPTVLKIYRKFFIQDTLKAGIYEVKAGMSVRQVLDMIANAENAQMNRILVIEGTTAKQLLLALHKDPLVDKKLGQQPAEIIKALNIPYNHLEGLFAPDTYFFDKGMTDQQILTDLYQRQMKILDAAWEKRDANLPYKNKYEALIMASIIEKETSVEKELRQVSGVFVRRLKLGMRLQTDPTVIYGMGDAYKGNITRQALRTPTAYNTYTINGLPPTPIALPSKKAIEAAMHPDNSDAVYFVATGNGGHKFSRSLEEHNRAVQAYRAVIAEKNKES
ncbi:endolytic transglycosylase MltG [Acinetobacter rudis]|uniref:Endolytic murein transglycosylase n=1 Tax=Acinetobacter rudis CIP 110305 TaxID=421052 RepID=S3PEV4_9GAMM|nr:endolytic transglycosylase MltG [Acinetobacter rudis]EPF77336.1 hypothetical protein F945_01002 [Acinetobacter rudis CIP 110305]